MISRWQRSGKAVTFPATIVAEAPNGSVRVQKVLSLHHWVIIPAHQVAYNSEIIEISAPPSPVTEFPDPPTAFC